MELKVENTVIKLIKGDIAEAKADAIVNAANNHLWMGSGVAGAIKKRGGSKIEEEAVKLGPIPIGEAVVTTAGHLKAKYVIHAAGMGTDLHTDVKKIENATRNSLLRAEELNLESIAFPSIGTGVGGFPLKDAANIMIQTAVEFIRSKTQLKEIIFVLYGNEAYENFERVLKERVY